MSKIKIIILPILVLTTQAIAQNSDNDREDPNDIPVYLSVDKNIYLENEDIPIFIRIRNNENRTDSIKNLSGIRLDLT